LKHSSRARHWAGAIASLLFIVLSALPAAADWTTYQHDAPRSGWDQQSPAFNGVSPDWTSTALDGAVYAQPLVIGNKVLVATEHNSVYAFDATTGNKLWQYNAGAPAPGSNFNCGNINPNGITGTPVVDPSTNRLYAVATVVSGGVATYELVTVDLNTGSIIGGPVILSYSGFDSRTQGQRGALALANNMIFIPFGGRDGDCTPYDGVIFGVPVNGGSVIHYKTPTAGTGAGIWNTGGVVVDGSVLLVATGNSGCPSSYDYDDSVIKLSTSLVPIDQFAPATPLPNGDWASLSCVDKDLGSASPALLTGAGLVFIQGKESTGYLLRETPLGSRFSGSTFNAGGDVYEATACTGQSFGADAWMSPYIFVPCNNGLLALKVDIANKTFSTAWNAGGSFSGPPIVAGGAVWNIAGGTLHAYSPVNGLLLYSHAVGPFSTSFPSPAAGDGRIFVANNTNVMSFVLNATCTGTTTPTSTSGSGSTTFYFAEGFTAPGFSECLSLLMPNTSGTATIDYWTQSSHTLGTVAMTAGQVTTIDVNQAVGANQEVSVRVTLPGPGIAERILHFNFGGWHGSTDIVGANAPSTEWNFAEGSTLGYFNEYLTLQNPNATAVLATLQYMTDNGQTPVKKVNLAANSRTTVAVFDGDLTSPSTPCPVTNGDASNCGVGRNFAGVSVSVTTPVGQPIVAERPFYVNGFGFGFAPNFDGHVAFGANAPNTVWNFAEGTTLTGPAGQGFAEYLTLQNPNPSPVTANIQYFTDAAGNPSPTKTLTLPATSRTTVEVFRGNLSNNAACSAANGTCGVGPNVTGVSAQVTASQPIVAERPMYMNYNFGQGLVAGATDALGAISLGTLFGFSALSTATSQNDYLTIQNPNATAATLTIDYYTPGGKATKGLTVNGNTRTTVAVFDPAQVGTGLSILGAVVTSTNAVKILVEKPTYSSDPAAYGATVTMGYSPASF
jgi:outer membrane protein assembly factor BamB